MKSLVVINPNRKDKVEYEPLGNIKFGSVEVPFGLVEFEQPDFDSNNEKNNDFVLIKVKAFSCNYRDKALLLNNFENVLKSDHSIVPFGSEFSGEIIYKGKNVEQFEIGDIVIPNSAYPDSGVKNVLPGIPTNFASLGWLRLHKDKLLSKPKALSNESAACFPLGAQTASSMVKKSNVNPINSKPVVFSSKSATSLFIIQHLLSLGITPTCLSTSEWSEAEKEMISPATVIKVNRDGNIFDEVNGRFTHVFDPFFDINIAKGISLLDIGGTYVTCGMLNQHPVLSEESPGELEGSIRFALLQCIPKNVSVIGNCLGTTDDLMAVINRENINMLSPIIDSKYEVNDSVTFVNRSFFDRDRFGKCVMIYND